MVVQIDNPTVTVPLHTDEHGSIRVGNTRVLLELVIYAYQQGASVNEIVESYPTLKPRDVHAVLVYYLENQAQIDGYMAWVEAEEERLRQKVEANYSDQTRALIERLRAEQKKRTADG